MAKKPIKKRKPAKKPIVFLDNNQLQYWATAIEEGVTTKLGRMQSVAFTEVKDRLAEIDRLQRTMPHEPIPALSSAQILALSTAAADRALRAMLGEIRPLIVEEVQKAMKQQQYRPLFGEIHARKALSEFAITG